MSSPRGRGANEPNIDGIFLQDVFVLNYFGAVCLFQVCATSRETVTLMELEMEPYKDGKALAPGMKPAKNPLVITEGNTYSGSRFEVTPAWISGNEPWLPIRVTADMPIFKEAERLGGDPYPCIAYAMRTPDYVGVYWPYPSRSMPDGWA